MIFLHICKNQLERSAFGLHVPKHDISRTGRYTTPCSKSRWMTPADFEKLAQAYGRMTDSELGVALNQGDLLELFDEE